MKAIIFDWGGVLIDSPAQGMLDLFAQEFGVTPEAVNNAYRPFGERFQKGQIEEHDLWEGLCAALGVEKPYKPLLWEHVFEQVYAPNEEMFSLASTLKDWGYKVGLLSNTESPTVRFFHQQGYTMFDVAVFSCEEGTAKPERRIYQIALERLGAKPTEVVFIDDRVDFIEGAQKLGMHTIRFENPQQAKQALVALSIPIGQ
ncbi:MAG: HAD family phosphatase [Deltaproteobacteria bacterium]|nr:HAD family phosphatase [Deltaproteobacteria bacterium]